MNNNCGNDSTMNIDNIFFYEDNNGSSSQDDDGLSRTFKEEIDQMDESALPSSSSSSSHNSGSKHHRRHQKDSKFTQIKVNVGIDEDLKMILEMVMTIDCNEMTVKDQFFFPLIKKN